MDKIVLIEIKNIQFLNRNSNYCLTSLKRLLSWVLKFYKFLFTDLNHFSTLQIQFLSNLFFCFLKPLFSKNTYFPWKLLQCKCSWQLSEANALLGKMAVKLRRIKFHAYVLPNKYMLACCSEFCSLLNKERLAATEYYQKIDSSQCFRFQLFFN